MSSTAQPTTKTTAASENANSGTAPTASSGGNAPGGTFQSASLYVGDLHLDITEGTLFEMFNRVGPVASIRVCRDAVTRRSLGYAYVNFHDVQDAERALDTMQYTEIKGRACRIMWSQRDPALRKSGVGNVFIKNLAKTVDNKHMFDIFSMFGNILSCKVVTDENGASKGYGYVHFETAEAATEAVSKLNGGEIENIVVSVTPFVKHQDRASQEDWTNLYVKQFPTTYEETDLRKIFEAYGTVASVFIKKDEAEKSTGTGFVNFENHEDAKKALEALHEKSFDLPEPAEGEATTFSLFVSKGQKKAERVREIKSKVDAMQQEKIAKFNGKNLFVKNLDDSIDDTFLKETFGPFGTITSAKVVREGDGPGAPSKGFGFVCYSTTDEASRAVAELNNKLICSKPIVVTLHQRKDVRRAQLAAQFAPRGMRYQGMPGGGMYGMPGPYAGPQNGFGGPQQRGPGNQNFGGFQGGPGFGPRGGMGGPRGPGGYGNNFMPPAGGFGGQPNMMQGGGPGQFRGPMGGRNMAPMRGGQGGRGPGGPMQQGGRGSGGPIGGPRPMGMQQGGMPMGRGGGAPRGYQSGGPMGGALMGGRPAGGMMMGGNPQMMNSAPQQMGAPQDNEAFDHEALASAPPQQQKNMIGEKLFPLIYKRDARMAPKITGMLLEMDNAELVNLIETPDALDEKIDEAMKVLEKANKSEPAE